MFLSGDADQLGLGDALPRLFGRKSIGLPVPMALVLLATLP